MLERLFKLRENQTNPKQEVIAGTTTFMTMSYIVFLQPAVLSQGGMDFGAVMVATILSSAVATLLMGLLANYPIALAPAMGHNFFFVFTVIIALGIPWQSALGAVFISGTLFVLLSCFGFREAIVNAVPTSLKHAITVGIGLLIAMVGLQWGSLVVDNPGTLVGLGDLKSPPVLLSIFGILLISIFMALKVRGAILMGMLLITVVGILSGIVTYKGFLKLPPSLSPTFLALDIRGLFNYEGFVSVILIFFILDLFDTVGTLVGVSEEAGLMRDGKLPRAREALLSDAIGTVFGSLLGTSTITSFIESAAGVAEGDRTGLSNMVTTLLMLSTLFFSPVPR
jgi:AGZA family xanthine/uracil permease-like MFS transporter